MAIHPATTSCLVNTIISHHTGRGGLYTISLTGTLYCLQDLLFTTQYVFPQLQFVKCKVSIVSMGGHQVDIQDHWCLGVNSVSTIIMQSFVMRTVVLYHHNP